MAKTFGKFTAAEPGSPPPGMYVPIEFPQLGLVGTRTRDGRSIDAETFGTLDLPRSIKLKTRDAGGHDGAEVSGRLDEVTVGDDGVISGMGWALNDLAGRRSAYLIKTQALRGNSMDLAVAQEDVTIDIQETEDGNLTFQMDFRNAKLSATTLLTEPAFDNASAIIPDGWVVEGFDDAEVEAIVASVAPAEETPHAFAFSIVSERPKLDHANFASPELSDLTPLFVDEGDRVYGHLAGWNTPHLNGDGVTPPRNHSEYAYYANKTVLTTEGFIGTGALTINGNHADKSLLWRDTIDHYANTCATWADVCIGEDEHGIWIAGQVRPGTSNELVHAGRASALSGDWRNIGGRLELVAALSVNTPGFPQPRARAFAHEPGLTLSLIGAGALAAPKQMLSPSFMASKFEVADLRYIAGRLAKEEAAEMLADWDDDE